MEALHFFKTQKSYSLKNMIRFIDLFAGIGGIRLGLEKAAGSLHLETDCVLSCEIDRFAQSTYIKNFGEPEKLFPDVTKLSEDTIPPFDILLAGFPCQAFSISGKRLGFEDTRGTLFFEVARILKSKRPKAFLLENVKGLLSHKNGGTFQTIINVLRDELGYDVHYKVLNAKDFGVPQNRERIYIVGFSEPTSFDFPIGDNSDTVLGDILQDNVDEKYYISQRYLDALIRHKQRNESKGNGFGFVVRTKQDIAGALAVGGVGLERNMIGGGQGADNQRIRKLTPIECERLQGFPDNWTDGVSNTQRYKQLGNTVCVPVITKIMENLLPKLD